jgi:S1-C subfamily serine protease
VGTSKSFRVTLSNGAVRSATLVASFPPDDLAVVKAAGSGFHPATLADSGQVRVGEIVLAMGSPLGLRSSVTQGIVSAVGRTVSEPSGNALPSTIQTSAAINPGNSGGALVDLTGRVVGIPTLAASNQQEGGAAPGIGFAIPSNRVSDLAGQMVADGRVVHSHRAYLGVQLADASSGGAAVAAVQPGGPAAQAGIQAGDVIVQVAGSSVSDAAGLSEVLIHDDAGQTVKVRVRRPAGEATVSVRLGEYPASP